MTARVVSVRVRGPRRVTAVIAGRQGLAGISAPTDAVTSVNGRSGPGAVSITKSDLDLANVDNKSSATIRSEITAANIAAPAHAAALKATPVDADEITGLDSAASFSLVRVTWANIKATLKAYFDTLYAKPGALTSVASTDYTFAEGDANNTVLHPASDAAPRSFTIPNNATVPFPVGTTLTVINQLGAGALTIASPSDVLCAAALPSPGSYVLSENGKATAIKITATNWILDGAGLAACYSLDFSSANNSAYLGF